MVGEGAETIGSGRNEVLKRGWSIGRLEALEGLFGELEGLFEVLEGLFGEL